MADYIPLEAPFVELERQIETFRQTAASQGICLDHEIQDLEKRAYELRKEVFAKLTPYETVQISRHPKRPNTLQLIPYLSSQFVELHGDRNYYDDPAIVGGLAQIGPYPVMIIGHQKGRGTKENIQRNFGMPKPEGYRKALRLMSMAERFNLPIVTLIDTPGAYPGIGAEQRGQSEAIGKNIMVMSRLKVPIVTIVIGEGGSGGALALGVGNMVRMLEFAVYSVISPEGCASILMKDVSQASEAANALRLTAASALELKVIDGIIKEPLGGAHLQPQVMAQTLRLQICQDLESLLKMTPDELRSHRIEKFMGMGAVTNFL